MSVLAARPFFAPTDPSFQANPYERFKPLYGLPPQEIAWEHMPRSMSVAVPRGMPGIVVARYDHVTKVLRDPEQFSSVRPRLAEGESFKPTPLNVFGSPSMVFLDPPEHTRLRRLLNRAFALRQIRLFEPEIERIVDQVVEQVRHKALAGGRFDLVADFANPIPSMVIAYLLGVPPQSYESFKYWSDTTVSADAIPPGQRFPPEIPKAAVALRNFMDAQIEAKRREPGDDMISLLLRAQEEKDALTDAELAAFAVLLIMAGNETTANLLGNGMLALCRHPDQFELLRNDPALLPAAVEEMLRFDPPQQGTVRWASRDTVLDGTKITKGQGVMVLLGAANHDPARFRNPDVFDVHRAGDDHLAFGEGIHFCLGAGLARCEAVKALAALMEKFPKLHLAYPDQEPVYKPTFFIRGLQSLMMAID